MFSTGQYVLAAPSFIPVRFERYIDRGEDGKAVGGEDGTSQDLRTVGTPEDGKLAHVTLTAVKFQMDIPVESLHPFNENLFLTSPEVYAINIPPVGADLGGGKVMTREDYERYEEILLCKPGRDDWCGTKWGF